MRYRGWTLLAGLAWALAATGAPQVPDTLAQRLLACTACHGHQGEGTGRPDAYFPRIAGKPAGYLERQLRAFADQRRPYEPMEHLLRNLSPDYVQEIAAYFAGLHPPPPAAEPLRLGAAERRHAQDLVTRGDPARGLPACTACHGEALAGMLPSVPALVGLHGYYINAQLQAWREGRRQADAPDCMARVASRLRAEELPLVSAWLAARPAGADPLPLPAGTLRAPLRCGSLPD